MNRDVEARLAQGLNDAIGSQTRQYFVEVVDIDRIEDGDVVAYSEALGNIKVLTGQNKWLTVGDRIYVARTAPAEKYAGYAFVSWVTNSYNRHPGSLLAFDPTPVSDIASLPEPEVARRNQIRLVNGIAYHCTDSGWTPFGAKPRQFVWFLEGTVAVGSLGAVVQLDTPATLTGVVLNLSASGSVDVNIEYSLDLVTWATVFISRPTISAGLVGGSEAAFIAPAQYAAGTWLRGSVLSATAASDLTVQLRLL